MPGGSSTRPPTATTQQSPPGNPPRRRHPNQQKDAPGGANKGATPPPTEHHPDPATTPQPCPNPPPHPPRPTTHDRGGNEVGYPPPPPPPPPTARLGAVSAAASPPRTAGRLNLAALRDLPSESRPRIDPRGLPIGIVHLGIGAFHRAHQAVYTEEAIARAGGDWGICGVTQRSRDVVDVLAPQDGLYAMAVRGDGPERLRVVASVREVRWALEDPDGLLERIAHDSTALITLTVSEKGYRIDPATDRLRLDDPDIAADLEHGTSRTVIGQIVQGLERRRRACGAPITVLCCDNLPSNGPCVAGLVREFVEHLPVAEELHEWIATTVRFPATMVDRIVPATTAEDREVAARALGVRDRGLVVTAVQPGDRDVRRPPAGVRAGRGATDDVAPYDFADELACHREPLDCSLTFGRWADGAERRRVRAVARGRPGATSRGPITPCRRPGIVGPPRRPRRAPTGRDRLSPTPIRRLDRTMTTPGAVEALRGAPAAGQRGRARHGRVIAPAGGRGPRSGRRVRGSPGVCAEVTRAAVGAGVACYPGAFTADTRS